MQHRSFRVPDITWDMGFDCSFDVAWLDVDTRSVDFHEFSFLFSVTRGTVSFLLWATQNRRFEFLSSFCTGTCILYYSVPKNFDFSS